MIISKLYFLWKLVIFIKMIYFYRGIICIECHTHTHLRYEHLCMGSHICTTMSSMPQSRHSCHSQTSIVPLPRQSSSALTFLIFPRLFWHFLLLPGYAFSGISMNLQMYSFLFLLFPFCFADEGACLAYFTQRVHVEVNSCCCTIPSSSFYC